MNDEEIVHSVGAHWRYLREVIKDGRNEDDWLHMTVAEYLNMIEYHYRTSMEHGWKHGKEETQ